MSPDAYDHFKTISSNLFPDSRHGAPSDLSRWERLPLVRFLRLVYRECALPTGPYGGHFFNPVQRVHADAVRHVIESPSSKAEWRNYLGDLGVRRGYEPRRHCLLPLKGFLHQQGTTGIGNGVLLRFQPEAAPTAREAALWQDQPSPDVRRGQYIQISPDPSCKALTYATAQGQGGRASTGTMDPGRTYGPVSDVHQGNQYISVRIGNRWVNIWQQFSDSPLGVPFARVTTSSDRHAQDRSDRRQPTTPVANRDSSRNQRERTPPPCWNAPLHDEGHGERQQPEATGDTHARRPWNTEWQQSWWTEWQSPTDRWREGDWNQQQRWRTEDHRADANLDAAPWRPRPSAQTETEPRPKRQRQDPSNPTGSREMQQLAEPDWAHVERVASQIDARQLTPGSYTDGPDMIDGLTEFLRILRRHDSPPQSGNWNRRWLAWCQDSRHGRGRRVAGSTPSEIGCTATWHFLCWYKLEPAFAWYCSYSVERAPRAASSGEAQAPWRAPTTRR